MGVFVWIAIITFIAFLLLWRWAEENDEDPEELRWKPTVVDPMVLPIILLVSGIMTGVTKGWPGLIKWLTAVCVDYTLLLTVYDTVLYLLLPLLRKHFHARTCALLWLLPNFLYVTEYSWMKRRLPKLIVPLPERLLYILLAMWFLGALGVFLWKIIQHFRFRKQIMRGSYPVSAQETLEMWKEMQLASGLRKPWCRLCIAPETKTPLTFGLSPRRSRVLLPEKDYSEEELRLVLRHELVHIRRSDLSAKLFYVFTKSIGWFHPLVWLSLRRSADDLELSCDEAVLLGESEETRRTYAELLLRTAGDERGITSCLSANAKALKHRLTGVMLPKKKRRGWVLIGVCILALLMGKGLVGVSYGETTVGALLGDDIRFTSMTELQRDYYKFGDFADKDALNDGRLLSALSDLRVRQLGGDYSAPNDGRELVIVMTMDGRMGSVTIWEEGVMMLSRSLGNSERETLVLPDGADDVFRVYNELKAKS